MRYLKQWRVRPGAFLIEGPAAGQGAGLPGGKIQKFVLDPFKDLLEP
jgi:hypothetical protein